MRQVHHRVEDLDAAIDINENSVRSVFSMAMYQLNLNERTKPHLHGGERRVDGGAANLDSHHGVELPNSGLERLEVVVLVGKDTETSAVYTQTYTCVYVLL